MWLRLPRPSWTSLAVVDVRGDHTTTSGTIRQRDEGREQGEVRPETVEQAVRQAHTILAGAGVGLAPSKIARLSRDYLQSQPPCSFRSYLIRNAAPSLTSLLLPVSRHGLQWVDPTGETAARNVDAAREAVANAS